MDDVLGEVLECSVCLNQLDTTAKVLPCQHTFCYGCLKDIQRSHKEIRCPECRVLIETPLESLPTNILLMRILEGFKKKAPTQSMKETKPTDSPVPATTDFSYILNLYNSPNTPSSNTSSTNASTTCCAYQSQSMNSCLVNQSSSNTTPNLVTRALSMNPFIDQPLNLSHSLSSSPIPFQKSHISSHSTPVFQQVSQMASTDLSQGSSCSPNLSISNPNLSQNIFNSIPFVNNTPVSYVPSADVSSAPPPLQRLSSTSSLSSLPAVTSQNNLISLSATNSSSNINSLENFVSGGISSFTNNASMSLGGGRLPSSSASSGRTSSFEKLSSSDVKKQAIALYDFHSSKPRDLVFSKNSIITIVKQIDSNWFVGEYCGKRGYLPSNYVKMISPSPSPPLDQCKGIALYDFRMDQQKHLGGGNASSASDCLTFSKGDVIRVLKRVDDNWGEGVIGNKTGIFPLNFVKLNFLAASLLEQQSKPNTSNSSLASLSTSSTTSSGPCTSFQGNNGSCSPHVSASPEPTPLSIPAHTGLPSSSVSPTSSSNMAMLYVAKFDYTPQKTDEVELIKGSLYAVLQKCQDGWYKGRCLTTHKAGVFPGNYLYPARGETIAEYITKRTSAGIGSASCSSSAEDSSSCGGSGMGSSGPTPPPVGPRMSTSLPCSSRGRQEQVLLGASPAVRETTQSPMRDRYRCTEAYPASSPRELNLEVGDIVYILEHHQGEGERELERGWLYGFLRRTGKSGVFPATFVEPF